MTTLIYTDQPIYDGSLMSFEIDPETLNVVILDVYSFDGEQVDEFELVDLARDIYFRHQDGDIGDENDDF